MTRLFLATGLAGLLAASPAAAQHVHMPGMTMPRAKPAPKAQAKPKAEAKPAPAKPTRPQSHAQHGAAGTAAQVRPVPQPAEPVAPAAATPPTPGAEPQMDHSQMDHSQMDRAHMDHSQLDHAGMAHSGHSAMTGAYGPYPMTRESSGTAWQPDASDHMAIMGDVGGWTLMGHAALNLVHSGQGGRRGDDKTFVSGMVMGMARRPLGQGTLQFRAGLSPDPLMGRRGYPLLLASGETANGRDRLIDRQHPHDLLMELSASVSQPIGPSSSLFLYGGLPGEPAFGPGAYMHRESIMDSPEAPISHHWLDSQHTSFGVLTAGVVFDRVKLEASRFNGREPDQHRWDIETGPLDSTALRASWNPTDQLALQASWAKLKDPEQLEPGVDQKRWSASAMHTRDLASGLHWASTLAWGRRSAEGRSYDALVAESSLKRGLWTFFGRGEMTENNELLEPEGDEHHGKAFRVGKVSAGAIRDFRLAEHLKVGVGGLLALNFVPGGLKEEYGSVNPIGGMAFLRLKVD